MVEQLLARLNGLAGEFAEVEARLGDPDVISDPTKLRELSKRHAELSPIVALIERHRRQSDDLDAARQLFADATGDDREAMRSEIGALEADIDQLDADLKVALLPKDPHAGRAVIVEIRGAEGGEEANLFARDLYEMYVAYATRMGWKVDVLSSSVSQLGGFDEVVLEVSGDSAWTRLKFEGGPHRVQRVPVTESQGRIHTSSATVTVMPEAEEIDVSIDPGDLQIDVYRSSSAGGQSVNTTDSAVRITHKPSGIVVAMQDERSQIQNRAKAMAVLRSRLLAAQEAAHAAESSAARRAQVGGGGRSEKIRTYNFKENRLSDHRIGLTLYRLQDVLAGDLDEVHQALIADERAAQLELA
jgi:peptide chain release factor 1